MAWTMAFDFACTDRRFAPPPLPDLHDRVEAVLPKASAPVQHGRSADAQGGCDAGVGHAVLRHQESFGPDDYAMRRRRAARPLFKEVPILFGGRTVSGDSPASPTQISLASLLLPEARGKGVRKIAVNPTRLLGLDPGCLPEQRRAAAVAPPPASSDVRSGFASTATPSLTAAREHTAHPYETPV